MTLKGRDAVVLGLGLTGLSLARYLTRQGARVRVADTRDAPPNAQALARELTHVAIETGPFSRSTFEDADLIAISPGVAKDHPAIAEAVAAGVELVGDIELFARALPGGQKVLAITGTNGKTTVTSLTGALARAAGLATVVAGNIGATVLDALTPIREGEAWPDLFVLELSSYQLETTSSLAPIAATVLNVTPNHLDRYAGIADYAAAKGRIFTNASVQVLNRDDPIARLMRLPGRTVQTFGATVPLSEEEWGLVTRANGEWLARGGELVLPTSSLTLVGRHNAINALAALALVSAVAKLTQPVRDALVRFEGLPHRMQRIADEEGVLFVDDSKATTVAATEAALVGIGRPVVLIAGGDAKGQSFASLKSAVDRACKAVLLIGRDAPAVAHGLAGANVRIESVGTLDAAVARAFTHAKSGDAVLLSPACASLDQFVNYAERGDRFAALVRQKLEEARPCASA
ncbi:MAG TPA: UDP-N-acetylmuramoyl-L-alanine--D-glutamate ligase [Casimicrobiaceae bacterium]|nr:UDP-N-acetylmuramoyl-L-alanine--D-glutamate ligase [Casimicrobiaceae bacterium]